MCNTCHHCRAKFLILTGNLHPNIITETLNIVPTIKRVKGEYIDIAKDRKKEIKKSLWFLISDSDVKSKNIIHHITWLINKFHGMQKIPFYLGTQLNKLSIASSSVPNKISIGIACSWYPMYDHGGPILSPKIMASLAQLNVNFSLDIYFTYTISTIQGFMEAAEILNIGKDLTHHDWLHILAFIKKFHNIPPSTLGTVCRNGDYLDDDGNVICNIRDYVS